MDRKKVLIADDDRFMRNHLSTLVESWGYEVTTACDGTAALEALRSSDPPQVAILDSIMPGLTGPEVCRIYRQREPEQPTYLMILTIRDRTEQLVEGLEAGADDYLVKPAEDEILHARIEVGLRLHETLSRAAESAKLRSMLEIAGALCHEINQPLQIVMGNSELLAASITDDDPGFEAVTEIRTAADRLGSLTRKLMQVTRYRTKPYLAAGHRIVDIAESTGDEG